MKRHMLLGITLILSLCIGPTLAAGGPPNPAERLAEQKEALGALEKLDGTWRGTAWRLTPSGEKATFTHTERAGPFLGETLRIVEGRSYDETGAIVFNALGVLSFDPDTDKYKMHSYAMGHEGDFVLEMTDTGFAWEMPQGPMKMVHTATITDTTWVETSVMHRADGSELTVFEMSLTKMRDTDWPEAGAVAKD